MARLNVCKIIATTGLTALVSCSGEGPSNLGVTDGKLAPCPQSPNCVCSDATDSKHAVAPFAFTRAAPTVWQEVVVVVTQLPRISVVTRTTEYLHAEARSRIFSFVDDLELHIRPEQGVIAVRSASRAGSWDFGVNRRRVETLRAALQQRGTIP
jgi:uncharacterized protein (DUF1499 family)